MNWIRYNWCNSPHLYSPDFAVAAKHASWYSLTVNTMCSTQTVVNVFIVVIPCFSLLIMSPFIYSMWVQENDFSDVCIGIGILIVTFINMLHVTYIKLVEYASYVEYSVKKTKKKLKVHEWTEKLKFINLGQTVNVQQTVLESNQPRSSPSLWDYSRL